MIATFIVSIINLIIKLLGEIANLFLMLLPPSPFNVNVIDQIEIPFLSYLNWVLPISFFMNLLTYWVLAIGLYYIVQVVLRWIKVVD